MTGRRRRPTRRGFDGRARLGDDGRSPLRRGRPPGAPVRAPLSDDRPVPKRQADAAVTAPNGAEPPTRRGRGRRWTFLSSHAQVLLCLARAPDQRLTEIAARVGITDSAPSR